MHDCTSEAISEMETRVRRVREFHERTNRELRLALDQPPIAFLADASVQPAASGAGALAGGEGSEKIPASALIPTPAALQAPTRSAAPEESGTWDEPRKIAESPQIAGRSAQSLHRTLPREFRFLVVGLLVLGCVSATRLLRGFLSTESEGHGLPHNPSALIPPRPVPINSRRRV